MAGFQLDICGIFQLFLYRGRMRIMIDRELLEIILCPACHGTLAEKNEGLKCQSCRRVYPVRDNIPILLVEEASIDPE